MERRTEIQALRSLVLALLLASAAIPVQAQTATPIGGGDEEIWGYADLHAHQFTNLAFGGVLFHGAPYHPGGIDRALPRCDFEPFDPFNPVEIFDSFGVPLPPVPVPFFASLFHGVSLHGPFRPEDLVGNSLSGSLPFGHNVRGWGGFNGWPAANDFNHQQFYHEWLKRAHDGGLELMVMHGQRGGSAGDGSAGCGQRSRRTRRSDGAGAGHRPGGPGQRRRHSGRAGRGVHRERAGRAAGRLLPQSASSAPQIRKWVELPIDNLAS